MRLDRLAAFGALITLPLCSSALAAQATPKHHSKLKGAVVGAAAGHMLGHHAKAGAVAGALVQHERNKKAARNAH